MDMDHSSPSSAITKTLALVAIRLQWPVMVDPVKILLDLVKRHPQRHGRANRLLPLQERSGVLQN